MLITYVGGPLHRHTDRREDLVTEADARAAVLAPAYSYRSSISSHGEVIEAIFVHMFATQADFDSCEQQMNRVANEASRFV